MENNYYYYPIHTENIMFVKGEKYVCLSNLCNKKMKKGKIYTCENFTVSSFNESIYFTDGLSSFAISPFDCGYFVSLKKQRKLKIEKLNKI